MQNPLLYRWRVLTRLRAGYMFDWLMEEPAALHHGIVGDGSELWSTPTTVVSLAYLFKLMVLWALVPSLSTGVASHRVLWNGWYSM